jgi:hypothetical protein
MNVREIFYCVICYSLEFSKQKKYQVLLLVVLLCLISLICWQVKCYSESDVVLSV